ncbi:MAG: hypothetical protein DMD99_14230, partial [Candidatus Rokuibacteriota bacterium]
MLVDNRRRTDDRVGFERDPSVGICLTYSIPYSPNSSAHARFDQGALVAARRDGRLSARALPAMSTLVMS